MKRGQRLAPSYSVGNVVESLSQSVFLLRLSKLRFLTLARKRRPMIIKSCKTHPQPPGEGQSYTTQVNLSLFTFFHTVPGVLASLDVSLPFSSLTSSSRRQSAGRLPKMSLSDSEPHIVHSSSSSGDPASVSAEAPSSPSTGTSVDSLPDSASSDDIDSESEQEESDAEREWKESLQQLELLLTMVVVPYIGKYFGRKCAYWGEFLQYQKLHCLSALLATYYVTELLGKEGIRLRIDEDQNTLVYCASTIQY